ncbi:MAG: Quinolinate synthetase protein [Thermodesulfobacteriota bacterium]|nr:Quinolinate synthetase protein [Thermodesulfobacteriota bacterium]
MRNTLEKILWSLQDMEEEIIVSDGVLSCARESIERMIRAG